MKKKIFILFLFGLMVFTTGCWSRRELNELSIVTGMGIDKVNGEYLLSTQVIRPSSVAGKGGGAGEATIVKYEIKGKTVFEALRRMTNTVSRRLYLSHLRILVFGEEFAREGIGPVLDFFSRDHELRSDFNITIVHKGRAADFLEILTPLEKIPGDKIHKSVEISERIWGSTLMTNIDDLIAQIASKGQEPVLSGIHIKGSLDKGKRTTQLQSGEPEAILQTFNLAVLKNDKLMGWLTEKESFSLDMILDRLKATVIPIPCKKENGKQNYITIEIIRSKTKKKVEITDDEPKIHIQIQSEANVADVPCDIDLTKTETIEELEQKVNKQMKKTIETSVKNVQKKFKLDIFGFGEMIHRKDPKLWKEIQNNWDEKFVKLPVDVTVNVKILRTGTINNSFIKNMQK